MGDALARTGEFRPLEVMEGTSRWEDAANGVVVALVRPGSGDLMNFLVDDPVRTVLLHRDGYPVRVPQPVRFVAHALAHLDEAAEVGAREKLLGQVCYLAEYVVRYDRKGLTAALRAYAGCGAAWRERLLAGVRELPAFLSDIVAPMVP